MATDTLLAPIKNAEHREVGGVVLDTVRTGDARVKRAIYPVGFRWSKNMKAISGTELCMHAHIGFLVRGRIHMQFADGCVKEFAAPEVVMIEAGHDGWVEGNEPAVIIEFDFEGQTAKKCGLPERHQH
jgi:hypothetical protein